MFPQVMSPVVANCSGEALQSNCAFAGVEYKKDPIRILDMAPIMPKRTFEVFFIIFIVIVSMVMMYTF